MTDKITHNKNRSEQILDLLDNTETWLSGEEIARILGISRAAVGKHICTLRKNGHVIAAATKRGYRLIIRHKILDDASITIQLKNHIFGKKGIIFLLETTSTTHEAVRQAMHNAPEGRIILAEKQTEGRGRKGRVWFSSPRSLQFSIILRPDYSFWDTQALTKLGVSAVIYGLGKLGFSPEYKAPNDIMLAGRKVAGVLLESGFRAHEPDWTILGIGCNVNALEDEFPANLKSIATSLIIESGKVQDRTLLFKHILEYLEGAYKKQLPSICKQTVPY